MKQIVLAVAVIAVLAASALATPIVDNDEIYIWGDPFGDQFDHYAEVNPGDTISLQIWVNDLNGSYDMLYGQTLVNQNWTHAANGARTGVWWDPGVVDGPSVHEDKHVGEDPTTYYSSYWGSTGYNNHLAHYWTKHYDNWGAVRWVAESRWLIDMVFTIREDAPTGLTYIGLEQGFFWSNNMFDPYQGYFFWDRIESDDPWGMQLNVLPAVAPGDFDNDGDVDADDINDLCANMTGEGVPPIDPKYDLDGDNDTDSADMDILIHDLVETAVGVGTEYADFNLDGEVNTTDLTILATNFGLGSTWAEGNANCDTDVNTTDLTILATNFGFVAAGAVPEPATMSLVVLGSLALLRRRSR